MGWIVRNPELRRLLFYSAILVIALLSVVGFITGLLHHDLQQQLIRRDQAVIGRLTSRHPQWAAEIVGAFYKKGTAEQARKGVSISARYGYGTDVPIQLSPLIGEFNLRTYGFLGLTVLAVFLVFLGVVVYTLKNIFCQINMMADASRGMIEPTVQAQTASPGLLPSASREGDLGKLAFGFNRIAEQLERNIGWLEAEKTNLKKLVSDISHQLKTPLASLKMYNELLQEELQDGGGEPIQGEFLHKSQQQIERMEWLIKNLLTLARIEAGVLVFHDRKQLWAPFLNETVETLRYIWKNKRQDVSVRVTGSAGDPTGFFDERWLAEAIGNIVKNCLEHTPDYGTIEIGVEASPVMTRLVISDNGSGISPEDLPHVFERFYQGRRAPVADGRQLSGTGLGLALAKAIIEKENGIISVSSHPGQGSVFTVVFPNPNPNR